MANKPVAKETAVDVLEIALGKIEFCLVGTTPFIYNAMSEKVRQELLMPKGRKTTAEKAGSLKHNPLEEYRGSVYRSRNPDSPTELVLPVGMFKGAIANAALDMPGAKKTQIGRLVQVVESNISMYGIPTLHMAVVRSADMNKTPDVRTRACLPEWACKVTATFVKPIMREQTVANLLAAAGVIIGVGDFRSEKGKGNYGSFRLASADDADYIRITTHGTRKVQEAALLNPEPYDEEARRLYDWFNVESNRRGFKVAA